MLDWTGLEPCSTPHTTTHRVAEQRARENPKSVAGLRDLGDGITSNASRVANIYRFNPWPDFLLALCSSALRECVCVCVCVRGLGRGSNVREEEAVLVGD